MIAYPSDLYDVLVMHPARRGHRYKLMGYEKGDPLVAWVSIPIGHAWTLRGARRKAQRWLNGQCLADLPPVTTFWLADG